jgi:hypothetical protein
MPGLPESDYNNWRQKAYATYAELQVVKSPETLFQIDRLRRVEGREPTQVGQYVRKVAGLEPQRPLFNGAVDRNRDGITSKADTGSGGGLFNRVKDIGSKVADIATMGGSTLGHTQLPGGGTGPSLQEKVGSNLRNFDRITGAPVRGALLNPSNPARGVLDAVRNPERAQLRNMGGIRSLNDDDILGPLSVRDIVGGAADALADVSVAGLVTKPGRKLATKAATGYRDATNKIPGAGMSLKDVGDGVPDVIRAVEPKTDPVQSLLTRIGEAKPLQEQNKELLSQFRSRQAGSFRSNVGDGEAGFNAGLGSMRGTADRVGFEPLRPVIGQQGVDELFTRLKGARLNEFEHANAGTALLSILDGTVPVPSELVPLEKAFPGITRSLQKAKIISGPGFMDYASDLANLPQSLISSFDLSGLRQVSTAAAGHPVMFAKAAKRMLQAAKSEDAFRAIHEDLKGRWYSGLKDDAGVAWADGEIGLTKGEGTIISELLNTNKVPNPYRGSQRAYTTVLNLMRDGVFQKMLAEYGGNPKSIPADELRRWGKLVNISTGRGDLPGALGDSKAFGAPIFWAPRLMASRVQMPFEVLSKSPIVRKEAARQIASFIGINSTILGMGAAAGAWSVETDPRSSDFGQIRVGPQRIDPWFGFRPFVNLGARLATGERKSSLTGEVYEAEHKEIIADFLRQKFSPLLGVATNVWTGRDAIGEPYTPGKLAPDLFAPLFLREVYESLSNAGPKALPGALLGGVGYGVNTYETSESDRAADEMFGKPFSRLSRIEKAQLTDARPDLAQERSDEIIRRGGDRAELEERRLKTRAAQLEDDSRVLNGQIDWNTWKDNRSRRGAELRGFSEAVFGDEPIAEPKDAYERWLNVIHEHSTIDGPDWDKVDAWIAQQPEADQKFITDNTGLYGTNLEKQRSAVAAELDAAKYFDIRDRVWERVAQTSDALKQFETAADFETSFRERIIERLTEQGVTDPAAQRIVVEDMLGKLEPLKVWSDISNEIEEAWITKNADLARRAYGVGYLGSSLRKDEEAAILGAAASATP